MSKTAIGQPAPDFELSDQDGLQVRLSQFRGRTPVVIFFYPKDETSGCTKEVCAFRDTFAKFEAKILGISSDSCESHARFRQKYNLPFSLLSDTEGRVRHRYEVPRTFGILPGRATYVVDREGILRHTFSSQSQPEKHIEEALLALSALQSRV